MSTIGSCATRLLEALVSRADHPVMEFAGRSYTFGELDALSRAYADRLRRLGVGAGDRVAVLAPACPESIAVLVGHLRSGVIHVPINTRYRVEETRHILEDSGACAVVSESGGEGAATLEDIRTGSPPPSVEHWLDIGPAAAAAPGPVPSAGPSGLQDEDVAALIYTSGTTGKSKGVALSYRALVASTLSMTGVWRTTPDDRLVLALPLFHVHGLCLGVLGTLLHGSTMLLESRFAAPRVVEAFERDGATVFMGVPTMYVRLLEHIKAHPEAAAALAKARVFISGSAPLPGSDFALFREKTGHAILERYGMTETLFTLSNPYAGERRPGTVGLPAPGCAARIVDEGGRDLPDGELGELFVQSNGMMNGYWRRDAETAASLCDGWFATGDMARRDSDGYFMIAGRKSLDFVKSGGFKISTREIEDVLRRHPRIQDVAVVGAPDPVWGERIVAAVVLDPASGLAPSSETLLAELSSFCVGSLADYKHPREVRILEELPRNALGKVQKHRI